MCAPISVTATSAVAMAKTMLINQIVGLATIIGILAFSVVNAIKKTKA